MLSVFRCRVNLVNLAKRSTKLDVREKHRQLIIKFEKGFAEEDKCISINSNQLPQVGQFHTILHLAN